MLEKPPWASDDLRSPGRLSPYMIRLFLTAAFTGLHGAFFVGCVRIPQCLLYRPHRARQGAVRGYKSVPKETGFLPVFITALQNFIDLLCIFYKYRLLFLSERMKKYPLRVSKPLLPCLMTKTYFCPLWLKTPFQPAGKAICL